MHYKKSIRVIDYSKKRLIDINRKALYKIETSKVRKYYFRKVNTMKVEFDVKITASDLYDYMLSHTYSGFSGLFGSIVGALFIVYYMSTRTQIYYLAAGVLILLYIPVSLYMRAKKQATTNEFFKKPLHYTLTDEGVTVTQGEYEMFQEWSIVYRAKSTNKSLLLYTSKVNAWIFPKRDLGEKREDVIQMISTHVSPDKVKIKQ